MGEIPSPGQSFYPQSEGGEVCGKFAGLMSMTNMKTERAESTVYIGRMLLTVEERRRGDTTAPCLTPNPGARVGV